MKLFYQKFISFEKYSWDQFIYYFFSFNAVPDLGEHGWEAASLKQVVVVVGVVGVVV